MKNFNKILILLSVLIIGYLVGHFVPIKLFQPEITSEQITLNDYYNRIINSLVALSTFLAVVVALFKEDIRKFWERAKLSIDLKDNNTLVEELEPESQSDKKTVHKAVSYKTIFTIENNGNLSAKNCELYLERLTFSNNSFPTPQEVQANGSPLIWKDKNDANILIPSTGKAHITVIEIISPSSQSTTSENSTSNTSSSLLKPTLKIGNVNCPTEFIDGNWEARFTLYSENTRPISYSLYIKWNGKWEQRLTEMKAKCVSIELKTK